MANPTGFTYEERPDGRIAISHRGRLATELRGQRARAFLDQLGHADPQLLMAKVTGNYKRGNERQARNHPRHR